MAVQVAGGAMRRISTRVPDLNYASDVDITGNCTVDIPAMPAALATGIINAQSVAAAGTFSPVVGFSSAMMGRYGRNVSVVLSGAGTGNVTLVGYDYLGQAIKETIALNGATPVLSKKMFFDVAGVVAPVVGAVTMNVGYGAVLGVPYKVLSTALYGELMNDAIPTAGALVAGVVTQTLTSGDPRGTYTPNTAPNGTNTYRFTCIVDRNQLHGSAHVVA